MGEDMFGGTHTLSVFVCTYLYIHGISMAVAVGTRETGLSRDRNLAEAALGPDSGEDKDDRYMMENPRERNEELSAKFRGKVNGRHSRGGEATAKLLSRMGCTHACMATRAKRGCLGLIYDLGSDDGSTLPVVSCRF